MTPFGGFRGGAAKFTPPRVARLSLLLGLDCDPAVTAICPAVLEAGIAVRDDFHARLIDTSRREVVAYRLCTALAQCEIGLMAAGWIGVSLDHHVDVTALRQPAHGAIQDGGLVRN